MMVPGISLYRHTGLLTGAEPRATLLLRTTSPRRSSSSTSSTMGSSYRWWITPPKRCLWDCAHPSLSSRIWLCKHTYIHGCIMTVLQRFFHSFGLESVPPAPCASDPATLCFGLMPDVDMTCAGWGSSRLGWGSSRFFTSGLGAMPLSGAAAGGATAVLCSAV